MGDVPSQEAGSTSALVSLQRTAITELVDAVIMDRAVDHQWMASTRDAWGRLARACIRQHQYEEKRGALMPEDPEVSPSLFFSRQLSEFRPVAIRCLMKSRR